MINFPKDYFNDEYREGFLVESMVKRAWGAQLEILIRISEICDKYGIQYFGFWGTMLGAVRHNGYIPWDDDFDIAMKRVDYDRFLRVAVNELPNGYVVISPYTEVEWNEQLARVTNTHSIDFTDDFLDEYHGFPYVAGVDIFPFDYIPDEAEVSNEQDELLNLVAETRDLAMEQTSILDSDKKICKNKILNEKLDILEKYFGFSFNREKNIDNQLLCLFDQIAAGYGSESSKYVTCFANRNKRSNYGQNFRIPSYCFDEAIEVLFENITIKIPKYYELCLLICYGKGYMKPKQASAGHDYPFFSRQEDILKDMGRYDEVMEAVKRSDERMTEDASLRKFVETVSMGVDNTSICNEDLLDGKKVIMCCVSVMDYYEYEEKCLEKLKSILNVFKDKSETVELILVNPPYVDEILYRKKEFLASEYINMLNQYILEGFGRLIEYEEVINVFTDCDAYYGSYNECAKLFTDSKKPVMIIDKNI